MTWVLVSGIVLTALGMFAAGIASGPWLRNAWWTLDDKRRDRRRERAASPYVPRHAESLPRRKPLLNRQPWQTADMPAIRVPAAQPALDPGDGLDDVGLVRPYLPTDEETREMYHGGVTESASAWRTDAAPGYGQAPQLEVEPELARRVIA